MDEYRRDGRWNGRSTHTAVPPPSYHYDSIYGPSREAARHQNHSRQDNSPSHTAPPHSRTQPTQQQYQNQRPWPGTGSGLRQYPASPADRLPLRSHQQEESEHNFETERGSLAGRKRRFQEVQEPAQGGGARNYVQRYAQQHPRKGQPLQEEGGGPQSLPQQEQQWQQPLGGRQGQRQPAGMPSQAVLYAPLSWARQHSSSRGHLITRLSHNIVDTVEALTPSAADLAERQAMLGLVDRVCRAALRDYPGLQVLPFGSYVSGLGTCVSDLDVVLVNVKHPRNASQGFYEKGERHAVAALLDRVCRGLRSESSSITIHNLFVIRFSRIPLAKLTASLTSLDTSSQPMAVDISIATQSGPEAAAYLAKQVAANRALRPLVLVLKAYLKVKELNEVASGGLSSYGLTYMVLAHLMEEGRQGRDVEDLGLMLLSFFRRYGCAYDTHSQVVSVKDGGIVGRNLASHYRNMDRICCLDPLTGRDCTEGTYRSDEVLAALRSAHYGLEELLAKYPKDCPSDLDILGGLINGGWGGEATDEQYTRLLPADDDYVA
ncbi:hypothetical protein V8C86DRAFT_1243488 [Haematococcus lacustris]